METEIRLKLCAAVTKTAAGVDAQELANQINTGPQKLADAVLLAYGTIEDVTAAHDYLLNTLLTKGFVHIQSVFAIGSDLPDTPTNFFPIPVCASSNTARLAALGLNWLLNKPLVAYPSENKGELFINLTAIPGQGRFAEKSTKGMRGHTDAVSFPFPHQKDPKYPKISPSPDIVCLTCLRNPDKIPTHVQPLSQILETLTSDEIKELKTPQYLIGCQNTFREGTARILGERHIVDGAAVLCDDGLGGTWVRYSHSHVTVNAVATDAAQKALDKFEVACKNTIQSLPLCAGDLALIDNRRALHGRAEIGGTCGGASRWLLRTYALDNELMESNTSYYLYP